MNPHCVERCTKDLFAAFRVGMAILEAQCKPQVLASIRQTNTVGRGPDVVTCRTTTHALPQHYRHFTTIIAATIIAALPLTATAAITLLRYHHCCTQKMKVSAQKSVGAGWDESESESEMS